MKTKLLQYGMTSAVGLAIALIIMSAKGVYTQTDVVDVMHILSDAFFVSGVIIACAGLLVFVTNGGVFDMLAYGFILIFDNLRRDVTKRKYKTFYDYKQSRQEKKHSMGFMLIVGLVLIGISVCFLIPYYALQQPK